MNTQVGGTSDLWEKYLEINLASINRLREVYSANHGWSWNDQKKRGVIYFMREQLVKIIIEEYVQAGKNDTVPSIYYELESRG